MRRQQFANTFVIMLFALGIVTLSAIVMGRWHPWQAEPRPQARHTPKAAMPRPQPAKPAASLAPQVPATVVAPVAVAPRPAPKPAPPADEPRRKPTASEKAAAASSEIARRAAPPAPPPTPSQPEAPPRSAFDYPGAGAAKRVLVSIKCLDGLAYEGEMHGRQYFSARCENGNRRSVSCAGAGCKIEYAPPPSHVP